MAAEKSEGLSHIGVILDGNGRWAKSKGLPRQAGHREGVEALRRTVEAAQALGVEHLTVFSFSTENWKRPPDEVEALFSLLRLYVHRDLDRLNKKGVRVRIVGSRQRLSPDLVKLVDDCERKTVSNTKFNLNIAFNYGGRAELVEAAKSLARRAVAGDITPEDIDEEVFSEYLWGKELPDVDLLIRTSGEQRISNFLLWHIAYSELLFTDVLWPNFGREDMELAIDAYKRRNRRFGGVGE